jgi:predicted DNA-binding transcriptional regulator AlpA
MEMNTKLCGGPMKSLRKPTLDRRAWLNRSQVAERIGRSRQTVWRWRRDGLLPDPDGTDPFGHQLWLASTVDSFLAANKEAA